MWILYSILGIFGLFLAVILVRAACFNPKADYECGNAAVSFDADAATDALQALVRCKTVSNVDPALEDDAEFEKLISLLPNLYPNVFETCEFQRLPDRGLLFRWKGKKSDAPSVMMAHYDVVPADEEKWDKPPFDGIIEGGVLWGRGTLDTKATFNGALFAANTLIGQGYQPENDIYFAFSGGEEVNGAGADNIVDYFIAHGIQPALVLDEGGAVVENVFPGVKKPCGLIGIAEKGMMNVEYKVLSAGGHASAPPTKTPITTLADACKKVQNKPFKMHITKPAAEMFDTLGRHSTFLYKIIFANMWCFSWVIDVLGKTGGGEMNALVRTTTAFTMMEGSTARNVLPTEAKLVSNMRLNPADSVASALAHLKKAVNDSDVEITVLEANEPSRISQTNCPAWDAVASTVSETWPGTIVAPYLMVQCSDSRCYGRISDHVYRFCAMDMTAEERKSIHGNNEKIRLESIAKTVEFYIRLLKKC
jgi:carboxypeptidase PM20D1